MILLLATTNPGKVREIRLALGASRVDLRTLANLPPIPEPEETGATFAANAAQKARFYAAHAGLPTVAEDSGLVIDALGGAPGVLSARYPGETYADKFANLYRELAPFRRPWTARFVCSLAFVQAPAPDIGTSGHRVIGPPEQPPAPTNHQITKSPDHQMPVVLAMPVVFACEATVEGEIAQAPRGAHGFGYDPIFFYPPYGKMLGEATDAEKLAVSHRGRAFQVFREWIERTSRA